MSTGYLLILGGLAIVFLYFARRKKDDKNDFQEQTMSPSERVIYVYDMTESLIDKAIEDFVGMYSDNGDVDKPTVRQEGDHHRLTFSPTTNYISMCYWVNYLVYSDENNQRRFRVLGWYPFGEVLIKGERQPFSNQTVMMYVDKGDTEHDNISFVTPDGVHYKQPFAITDNIQTQDRGSETYQAID